MWHICACIPICTDVPGLSLSLSVCVYVCVCRYLHDTCSYNKPQELLKQQRQQQGSRTSRARAQHTHIHTDRDSANKCQCATVRMKANGKLATTKGNGQSRRSVLFCVCTYCAT